MIVIVAKVFYAREARNSGGDLIYVEKIQGDTDRG
jgi:hypothetical protein